MKKCGYCGLEHPDEATQCVACHNDLIDAALPVQSVPKAMMPPEERRFWEQMTFRQFTILFLRLQAVWLLFYAAIDVTYLPPYFIKLNEPLLYSSMYSGARLGFFLTLLRIIMHVAAALAAIQYSERLVNWFARDWIQSSRLQTPPSNLGR